MRIGIMQGRLVPPVANRIQCFPENNWADEFSLAAEAGLASIEWIYEVYGAEANPLATDEGVEKIQQLSAQFKVGVFSLCADYFIDRPLLRLRPADFQERLETLRWLMARCQKLGIRRLVLPFVDASRIESDQDLVEIASLLTQVLPCAEENALELHLETSLPPDAFASLLEKIPHPLLKANYDSGNSASLGYPPEEEWAAYGPRIGSVHIKDRLRGGSTVPLGTGAADFPALRRSLKKAGYTGDFILQVARGLTGDELAWARQNRSFFAQHIHPA